MTQTLSCPLCGGNVVPVRQRESKVILFYGCVNYRSQHCSGRFYPDPEHNNEPFFAYCYECGRPLSKGYGKNGSVYCACFNKEKHSSGETIWYKTDGTARTPLPKAKGEFSCPECSSPLKYIRTSHGKNSGSLLWLCGNEAGHADHKAHFFPDENGVPLF